MIKKSLAIIISAVAIVLSGCGSKEKATASSYESTTIVKADNKDSVIIKAVYPVGGDARFNRSVMEYLSERMGGTYVGSYDSPLQMFQHYADNIYANMQADAKNAKAAGGVPMKEFQQYDFKKVYETKKFATFVLDSYVFNGGAHGYGITQGFTVRKSDGRVMGNNMLNTLFRTEDVALEWNQTIIEGLMKAWGFKSEKELMASIFNENGRFIPQPQYPPFFTKDGLVLIYQSDEIAAHAAGKAEVVIPYDKVKPFLNVTGKRLISD